MAKKHNINMLAAWARSWGIKGYEHLDPTNREKNRRRNQRSLNERNRRSVYNEQSKKR